MIIKHVCEANDLNSYVSMNFNQIKPMNELKKKGVKFRNLNNKVLINLRKAWKEVIQEESKKDPLFAEFILLIRNLEINMRFGEKKVV